MQEFAQSVSYIKEINIYNYSRTDKGIELAKVQKNIKVVLTIEGFGPKGQILSSKEESLNI